MFYGIGRNANSNTTKNGQHLHESYTKENLGTLQTEGLETRTTATGNISDSGTNNGDNLSYNSEGVHNITILLKFVTPNIYHKTTNTIYQG